MTPRRAFPVFQVLFLLQKYIVFSIIPNSGTGNLVVVVLAVELPPATCAKSVSSSPEDEVNKMFIFSEK